MYEATKSEKIELYLLGYSSEEIKILDEESDKIRQGIPANNFIDVINYQSELQSIRKSNKKWWMFWKK